MHHMPASSPHLKQTCPQPLPEGVNLLRPRAHVSPTPFDGEAQLQTMHGATEVQFFLTRFEHNGFCAMIISNQPH